MNYDKSNKEKIKRILKLAVHIIGYISTFIVLFLSIIMGVQSCNNQDNRQEKPINNAYRVNDSYYFNAHEIGSRDFYLKFMDDIYRGRHLSIVEGAVPHSSFINGAPLIYNFELTSKNRLGYVNNEGVYTHYNSDYYIKKLTIEYDDSVPNSEAVTFIFKFANDSFQHITYREWKNNGSNTEITWGNLLDPWGSINDFSIYYMFDKEIDGLLPLSHYSQSSYEVGYNRGYNDAINKINEAFELPYNYDFRSWISTNLDDNGLMKLDLGLTPIYSSDVYYNMFFGTDDHFDINGHIYNGFVIRIMTEYNHDYIYNSSGEYKSIATEYGEGSLLYGLIDVHAVFTASTMDNTWHRFGGGLDSLSYLDDAIYSTAIVNGYEDVDFNNNGVSAHARNFQKYKWLAPIYRTITDYYDSEQVMYTPTYGTGFTLHQLLLFNDFGFVNYNVATTNAFSLLTSAFNSIGNILSIAILPNITIGILLFIPLIVTIVLFIIKLLRK